MTLYKRGANREPGSIGPLPSSCGIARTLVLAAAMAAMTCAPVTRHGPALDARRLPESVTIALEPYFRELKTVRVVDGTTSLTLLLDTGGGATLITPEVAARRGCQPYGRDVGHRMTGEQVEFRQCADITLTAGRWQHRFTPVAVFDVNALLPPELPRLDGVLALDAFLGQVVTIDWPASRISVHRSADARAALSRHGLPIRLATGESGRMLSAFVPVEARQGRLWFLLDSGNLRGTLVAQHVIRDHQLTLTQDGMMQLAVGRRPAVSMPAGVGDLAIDGALGTSFLMQGPIALDLRGRE